MRGWRAAWIAVAAWASGADAQTDRFWLTSAEKYATSAQGIETSYGCGISEGKDDGADCALSKKTWVEGSNPKRDNEIKKACGRKDVGGAGGGASASDTAVQELASLATAFVFKPIIETFTNLLDRRLQEEIDAYTSIYESRLYRRLYPKGGEDVLPWRCLRYTRYLPAGDETELEPALDFIAMIQRPEKASAGDAEAGDVRYDEDVMMAIRPLRLVVAHPRAKFNDRLRVGVALSSATFARSDDVLTRRVDFPIPAASGAEDAENAVRGVPILPLFPISDFPKTEDRKQNEDKDGKHDEEEDQKQNQEQVFVKYWIDGNGNLSHAPVFVPVPTPPGKEGPAPLTELTLEIAEIGDAPALLKAYRKQFKDQKADLDTALWAWVEDALASDAPASDNN